MNFIKLISSGIVFLLSSCTNSCEHTNMTPERKEESKIEDETLKIIDQKVCSKGFRVTGFGGGTDPIYRKVNRSYSTKKYHLTSIKEARELLCEIYDIFACEFNNEKRLQSSTDNQPFSEHNLDLSITFFNDESFPYIRSVYLFHGKVIYREAINENKDTTIHQEPFTKAYSEYLKNKMK
ncbi:MAG: hypothetical protein LLF94_05470 [Chlamydiales bacterium]|nr:hypothetical protein [Chlamydiales bacterium]